MRCVFFLQTSNLHPNKKKYINEKETLYFIIQNNNKNRKHIKNKKIKKLKEIGGLHSGRRSWAPTNGLEGLFRPSKGQHRLITFNTYQIICYSSQ